MRRTAAVLLVGLLLFSGAACGTAPDEPAASADPADPVAAMSDEELAGQVLMPYAYGQGATKVSEGAARSNQKLAGVDTPAQLVQKLHLGGVVLVGFEAGDPTAKNTANIVDAAQVRAFTAGLRQASAQPLLIATDQEFGVVTRVKSGVTVLPSALAAGAAHQPELTEAAWKVAGTELAAMGVNVDFAPDADVQGASGVIGSRSFGDEPERVAEQASAAVRGLQSAGVAATLKHFPGHGRPAADSHSDLPRLDQSQAELEKTDLVPFQAGIAAGARLVMSGHLDVQAVDPGVPASFSSKVLTGLLREKLGYQGVVVTDALNMSPAMRWPSGEAAVRALLAGNDLLLMPPDPVGAYQGILDALKSGQLPRDLLRASVRRLLDLKKAVTATPQPAADQLATTAAKSTVAPLAAAAVTILKGRCDGGPLVTGPVTISASDGRQASQDLLARALVQQGVQVVAKGGTVVHLVGYGDAAPDLRKDADITVAMDLPGILAHSPSPTLLATYSSSAYSLEGLAAVLAGKQKAAGRSPVAVNGLPRSACAEAE